MNKLKAFLAVSASVTMLSVFGCASSVTVTPYIEPPLPEGGLLPPGGNLTEKLAWLEKGADSRNLYIVEVKADESVAPRTLEYEGATDVTIVLRGVGENRTLRLASHGTMFKVKPNVTFILENILLHGHSQNTGPMVEVDGGDFVMRSMSAINGNDRGNGNGGGVYVRSGNFKMTGFCVISNNTADNGGGVFVDRGTFEMHCGMINGNIANKKGGGVYSSTHRSERPSSDGGYYDISNFTMGVKGKGGEYNGNNNSGCAMITGNTAREEGGGVYTTSQLFFPGHFLKHGIVTGYNAADPKISNVVKDEGGNVLSGKGHAFSQNGTCYGYQYSNLENVPCNNGIGRMGGAGWGDIESMMGSKPAASPAVVPAAAPPATPVVAPPEPPATIASEPPAAIAPATIAPETAVINNDALQQEQAIGQTQTAPKVAPSLVGGYWDNASNKVLYSEPQCGTWYFNNNGTGRVLMSGGDNTLDFKFTVAGDRLTFRDVWETAAGDSEKTKINDIKFSFSDDGKELILNGERFKKINNAENGCCCK